MHFSHQEPRDIPGTAESGMLISALISLLIRDQRIAQEVSAEWRDIEEPGEDAGREENVERRISSARCAGECE